MFCAGLYWHGPYPQMVRLVEVPMNISSTQTKSKRNWNTRRIMRALLRVSIYLIRSTRWAKASGGFLWTHAMRWTHSRWFLGFELVKMIFLSEGKHSLAYWSTQVKIRRAQRPLDDSIVKGRRRLATFSLSQWYNPQYIQIFPKGFQSPLRWSFRQSIGATKPEALWEFAS